MQRPWHWTLLPDSSRDPRKPQPVHRILGIDLGTALGWSVVYVMPSGRWVVEASGVYDLGMRRGEGTGMRVVYAARAFANLTGHYRPTIIGYEMVKRHQGTHAAHVYGALEGQLQRTAEERATPYTGIPVTVVKQRATGKGNADKEDMMGAATPILGRPPEDDNEADALFVALCAGDLTDDTREGWKPLAAPPPPPPRTPR